MNRVTESTPEPRREAGQTMAEYSMVLAVITLAILLTIQLIGDSAGNMINNVAGFLS